MSNVITEKRKRVTYLIVILIIVRILLQMSIPIWARCDYAYDDGLMVKYGQSIIAGNWLGIYSDFTLNKVPGFGIYLALIKFLNIPYMMSLGILYSLAALAFYYTFKKIVKNEKISLICFIYILFSPSMLDINISQRVYRMSVSPPLVLLIVSSYLAIFAMKTVELKKICPWIIIAAISYASFSIMREDAIWMSFFVFGAVVLIFIKYLIENESWRKIKRAVLLIFMLLIPFVVSIATSNVIKAINYKIYGLYTTNDFTDTYFGEVGKDLFKIEAENEVDGVYVTRETIEKIYEISPTFATLKPNLDSMYEAMEDENGEIKREFIIWAIRWASGKKGIYYKGAEYTNNFFKQIHNEIQQGFEDGRLEKRNALVLSNMARPIKKEDIPNIIKYSIGGVIDIISYNDLKTVSEKTNGDNETIRKFEDITGQSLKYPTKYYYELSGWMFANDGSIIKIKLYDNEGRDYQIQFNDSEDVYKYFNKLGETYENAKKCRFSIKIEDVNILDYENSYVEIYKDDELMYKAKSTEFKSVNIDGIEMNIEKNKEGIYSDIGKAGEERNIIIPNFIIKLYQWTGILFAVIAILISIIEWIVNIYDIIKKKNNDILYCIMKLGLLLTMYSNVFIISVNYFQTDASNFREHYAAGVYPIWQVFVCLSLGTIYLYFTRRKKDEINNSDTML